MKLRERYRRLTLLNKIAFWGAIASIVAIPLALILYILNTFNSSPEVPNVVSSEAQLHGQLMPANDPDPKHRCKEVPPGDLKIFLGENLFWSNPNKQVTALSIDGQDIIVLTEESGGVFLSANLYREDRRVVAKIVRNQFEINPNNYFKLDRPDRHELNIFDKNNRRVLHVRFLNETTFMVEGVFYGPKKKVEVTQDEVIVGDSHFSGICGYVSGAGKTVYFSF